MDPHPVAAVLDHCLELRLRDPHAALAEIEKARKLPFADPPVDIGAYRASLDASEAACLRNLGENAHAREIAERVLVEAAPDDHYARATAMSVIGAANLAQGRYDLARTQLGEVLEIIETHLASPLFESVTLLLLGAAHREDLHQSRKILSRAIRVAPLGSQTIPLASSTLAGVQGALGDYEGALHSYAKALSGNRSVDNRRGMAWALHNLAATYANLERWELAAEANRECLDIIEGSDGGAALADKELPAFAQNLRGRIECTLGRPERGLVYFQRAIELAEVSGDLTRRARALTGFGNCEIELKNPQGAIPHFEEAIEILGDRYPEQVVDPELGVVRALSLLGRAEEAHERFAMVMAQVETLEHVEGKTLALRIGAELHERAGRFEEALGFERRRFAIREQAQAIASNTRFEESRLSQDLERARYREGVLLSVREDLEAKVAERTKELERANLELRLEIEERERREGERVSLAEQLVHSQSLEAIGRTAADLSNRLEEALTTILERGDFLAKNTPASAQSEEAIHAILAAAKRASEWTRQLLTESQKQSPHPSDSKRL